MMSKKIHNGPIGKLFRTIGFLLILFSSSLLAISYGNTFNFISTRLTEVNNFISQNLNFIVEYTYLILIIGIILLIWTQTKTIFVKVLMSILTILVLLFYYQVDNNILPSALRFNFLSISLINNYINDIKWLTFAVLGSNLLFLYLLFGFKKPSRFSSQLVSSSMLLVLVGLLIYNLPVLMNQTWDLTIASNGVFIASYLVMALGSFFGVLGFARK